MAYFHKDKNILHIGESENKYYTYDINTGKLIGLRGVQISRTPSIFITLETYRDTPMYYKNMITCIRYSCINHASKLALFIDKYYAMPNHIPTTYGALEHLCATTDSEEFFKKYFAKYMEYCTERNVEVSSRSYENYFKNQALMQYIKYIKDNNELTNWQKEFICIRLSVVDKEVPRLKKLIAKVMSHPNYWEYNQVKYSGWVDKICLINTKKEPDFSSRLLNDTIDIYRKIPELPLVKANTINEAYLQVQRLASSYMAEQEARHKELYKSYLEKIKYEDENFTMILPTTAEELQKEGTAQSNCVGGYYHHIANMTRFIVFIRDKKNIDKPLITCDIIIDNQNKALYINQYLLSHNYTVTVDVPTYDTFNKDISTEVRKNLLIFKENFQKHLDKISIM